MEARKQREREFHNQRTKASQEDLNTHSRLTSNKKFYSITRKSKLSLQNWIMETSIDKNKKMLDYCCGTGGFTCSIASNDIKIVGIDISDVSIAFARTRSINEHLEQNVSFFVMDAENLAFCDESFDVITCNGVLHHLDICNAYRELSRVLKHDGVVICGEPLAYNPVFQLYRKMTPQLRTQWESEHILKKDSIFMAKKYFGNIDMRFFHLTTLLAVPLRNTPIFNAVLSVCEAVDEVLLKLPGVKWWAWQIRYVLSEPRKDG